MERMTDFEDENEPWADPAIRLDYEAALGRFVIVFNEGDYYIGSIIRLELRARNRLDIAVSKVPEGFAKRLELLDVLMSSSMVADLSTLSLDALRSLNTSRNLVVHGHFDENPFDGSYKLISKQKEREFPIELLIELNHKLFEIVQKLRVIEMQYLLSDLPDLLCHD
jgi:hypothetical protein